MKTRKLGHQGFEVTEVGLGCWQLGGKNWGDHMNDDRANHILQAAVDQGIRFFDTADEYGEGQSEILIGKFLKQSKADIKVATKFGKSVKVAGDFSESKLRSCVKGSLERLGVNTLDLLQLHCLPQEVLEEGEIFHALRSLKQEGLIRHFGASVESLEEARVCLGQEGLTSLQVIFNLFRQTLVRDLFPIAHKKGVGIIVRLPMASGLLTGKFTKETTFLENDHRNFNQDGAYFNAGETFSGLPFQKGISLADTLKTMIPNGVSMPQFALRWILDHTAVTTVIPGASSPEQVIGNASASNIDPVDPELMEKLRTFYYDEVHNHIRGVY